MKRKQGTPMALPAFSVDSIEDAEALKMLTCRKTYPPHSRYVINVESGFVVGDPDSMERATEYLEERYRIIRESQNTKGDTR